MKQDGYEVLGIVPIGAGYLFVNDRSMDTAGELTSKRMATLDYQKDAIHIVNFVKATVVPSDITNFAGKFNNGSVDTAYAPDPDDLFDAPSNPEAIRISLERNLALCAEKHSAYQKNAEQATPVLGVFKTVEQGPAESLHLQQRRCREASASCSTPVW